MLELAVGWLSFTPLMPEVFWALFGVPLDLVEGVALFTTLN
jgi:hypothetical protein